LCNAAGEPVALEASSDPALLEAAAPADPPLKPGTPLKNLYGEILRAQGSAETPAAQQSALLALQAVLVASRNIGNPEDAKFEDMLDKAAKQAPDSLWINFLSSQLSRKRNVSILAAEKVLARDPAAAGATQEILDRKSDAGLLQMAEQTARKMLENRQGDPGLWQAVIADALQQRHDSAQARQVWAQAVEFRPLDAGLWLKHWGSLDTESEKSAEAQRALHYLGGHPQVLSAIARWKADNFHADEAAQLIQNALAIHPQSGDLLDMAIEFNIRAGKPEAALALVEDSLKVAPGHPELLAAKGELLRRLHPADDKVKKEVIGLFEESLAARPENPHLREYVELLKGKTEDWFKPYDLSADDVKALIIPTEKFTDYPNDNMVNLLDQQVIHVNENGTSEMMAHTVMQVLRPQAIRQASRNGVGFNAARESVKVLRAVVYDSKGNEIGRGEVRDGGSHGGTGQAQGRIYDDGYTSTTVSFTKLEVGSVVDFQYLKKDTKEGLYGNYFADLFYLGDDDPTKLCQYILDLPKNRTFNMKSVRMELAPVELAAPAADRRVVKFERKDIAGLPRETNTPPVQDSLPFVQVSTFTDWNDVGKWFWQLSKEQFTPDNDKLKARVAEVIKDAKTPTEKLRAINDAVIKDIHYVGIELGRNGYKPHRADQTLASKMGDCKDCATLIASMCNLADVPAKLVLIRTIEAGENPKDALAAPNLFNHCIAYVPDCEGKAYWLDGTTNTNGLGEVPPSDQGANVLLINAEGGQWATIPRDTGDKNMWKTTIDVTVNADGSGTGHVRIDYTGFWQQWNRAVQEQAENIKRNMEALIGRVFPKATLSGLKVGDPKDFNGPVFFEFDFKAPQIGSRINDKDLGLVLEPFPWRWSNRYANEPERKQDLWVHFQYTIAETMVLHLPEGATLKVKPEDVELKDNHAVFTRKLTQDGQTITIVKAGTVLQETVKAADYPAFKKWANRVDELENDSLTIQMK
ncbi:MAG TPA: DUF3857 domain-containing protein, partial [Planctomycetota bacterium]|nr:DUF3857 domain-containing protein [Planctomycetota bacterium]